MAFSKYNKGRPFLVITQHLTPVKGENTSLKDWGKTGKKNLQEMVSIVDSVQTKHLTSATVIIDILKRQVVKSRYPDSDEEVMKHYLSQYKSQVAEGIQIWMSGQYTDEEGAKKFMSSITEEIDALEDLDNVKIDVNPELNDEEVNILVNDSE